MSYISKLKEITAIAVPFAYIDNVEHNIFNAFRYYQAIIRLRDKEYSIYLNVGNAKNGDGYYLYDIKKRIRCKTT